MGSGPTFDKLNMVNYVEWAMLMEALLVRKSLWEVVSGADATCWECELQTSQSLATEE